MFFRNQTSMMGTSGKFNLEFIKKEFTINLN